MAADGKVVFEITADDKPLKTTVGSAVSWLKKQTQDFQDTLKAAFAFSIGKTIAEGIEGIGTAIKDFIGDSIQAASALEEVQNVVDVTFGDDAKTIETWAKKANKQFGLTELQAKNYTSTLGAMMKSSGLTGKAVTSMSTDLAGLAADMASFYNLDFDTAFEKIRSGISGETEPLKQLGINLSVANLEAFALAQGITKSYESMSQAEQVTLRYNYLMQATADAQGDFARTSDSFANAQRVLQTNFETLKTNIGSILLPILSDALVAINSLFAAFSPEITVLDTFDQIEAEYEAGMAALADKQIIADALISSLEALEGKTELTAQEQLVWNATVEELVNNIPELSSIINTQTGEINGGTKAIREYIAAWSEAEEKGLYETAIESKVAAYKSSQQERANAQVEYDISYAKWRAGLAEMEQMEQEAAKVLGLSLDEVAARSQEQRADMINDAIRRLELEGLASGDFGGYAELQDRTAKLNEETYNLGVSLEVMDENLAEAKAELESLGVVLDETANNADTSSSAVEQMTTALQGQSDFLTSGALDEALANIEAYLTETFNAYRKSLDSVHGLFDAVDYDPAEDARTGDEIQGALNRNVEYWTEYEANLNAVKARLEALGLDAGFLADFADGSEESAGVLAGLVSMSDTELQSMAETQQAISDAKDGIATTLTELKASADEEFTAMIEKWEELAESFNQQQAATTNITLTANAVTGELQTLYASVSGYVTSINAKLGEIGSVSLSELSMPSLTISTSTRPGNRNSVDGMHADGLDYVPFDGYVAMLHRGETVLNAEAASLWRAGRAQDIDYRAMAAAFWQGMPPDIFGSVPAPQVYVGLDGNEIASRVSIQQGQEYKTYERSGWSAPV